MPRKIPHSQFVADLYLVHGSRVFCAKNQYTGSKCIIHCAEHGNFSARPTEIITKRRGCPQCGNRKKGLTKAVNKLKVFKKQAPIKFNDKFTYDYSTFRGHRKLMKMFCPVEGHGEFWSEPSRHLYRSKAGCPKCGELLRTNRVAKDPQYFIDEAKKVHGNAYRYISIGTQGHNRTITFECRLHGKFTRPVRDHIHGSKGCPLCGQVKAAEARRNIPEQVIKEIKKKFPDKVNFSKFVYRTAEIPFILTCKKHKVEYETTLTYLRRSIRSHGCKQCYPAGDSQPQRNINQAINELGIKTKYNDHELLNNKEIDILILKHKLGIEYNGLIWHSTKYKNNKDAKWHMLHKQRDAKEKGIFVAHFGSNIPEEKIVRYIQFRCGKTPRVFARKTKYKTINKVTAERFFDEYHIQKHAKGCQYSGLYLEDNLVGAIAMSRANSERGNTDQTRWELRRMVFNCQVIGGASKLFKNFLKNNPEILTVISYSDNRWFEGGVYKALEFILVNESMPDYAYTRNGELFHKSRFRHKVMAKKKNFLYDSTLTESQNTEINGFFKIWDCGKKKWEFNTLRPPPQI